MRAIAEGWLRRWVLPAIWREGGRRTQLLDAGCGTGALAVEAALRGAQVVAIDLSPTLVQLAGERQPAEAIAQAGGHIHFCSGDMLDPALGCFDHVVGMEIDIPRVTAVTMEPRAALIEYKAEAFKIFEELMVNIKTEICHNIFRSASSLMAFEQFLVSLPKLQSHGSASAFDDVSEPVRNTPSQPRNGEKNGNAAPVPASTRAMVEDMPE